MLGGSFQNFGTAISLCPLIRGLLEIQNGTPSSIRLQLGLTSGGIAQHFLHDTMCSSDFLLNSSLSPPKKKTNFNQAEKELIASLGVLGKDSAFKLKKMFCRWSSVSPFTWYESSGL